ncbi:MULTISPECIES: SIR2 family protein [unclassified Bradyrhizobium]|uniref:P-loop NTPase n=1 Tax=unclassified Bradyrhizobium TaxID=2631580 RepID=UPI00291658B6|nr:MULTISPECIES: SIR2 family protein [unclassified Bradyrhizobium]
MDLPGGDTLRKELVKMKNLRASSSLARAYAQLSEDEIEEKLTERFSNCTAGETCKRLTTFIWSRIYTLNIDDALENAYTVNGSQQIIESLTHKSPYVNSDDVNLLKIIHVHGWARKPGDGYVFSLADYANSMGPGSAWINVLAQTIATQPFIIAGTSLEEPDLEYFLAGRSKNSVRRDRGPSFLIEPYPDDGTLRDCDRHGLNLYPGSLQEFLKELEEAFPSRPLPAGATFSLTTEHFGGAVSRKDLALFSRDFSYVIAHQAQENADLGFYVGREPSFSDIALARDISRSSTTRLKSEIRQRIDAKDWSVNFLVASDNAGGGKTTILARCLYDLAGQGIHIFDYHNLSTPDISLSAKVFNSFTSPFVISCDNFADHASAIVELYRQIHRSDFLIVATERSYRMQHVRQILAGNGVFQMEFAPFDSAEARALIVKMHDYGLTSSSYDPKNLDALANELTNDSIAIAVCRIMNDFRPVERIVESLITGADNNRLQRYLACALASYCYKPGLAYQVLNASFPAQELQNQLSVRDILPLTFFDHHTKDYVVPVNPILGQRILRQMCSLDEGLMLEIYSAIGAQLVAYVNRSTIMKRTPEARLAGRLFDYDEVLSQFLPTQSEAFFLAMKRFWSWNSRYWEQFALMKLDRFLTATDSDPSKLLNQAISHAKHAVQVERHPLPLTTLGKILFEEMKHNPTRFKTGFDEAFTVLTEAIAKEGGMNRIVIHPYMTLFGGVQYYVRNGGTFDRKQIDKLNKLIETSRHFFSHDSSLMILANEIQGHISARSKPLRSVPRS